MEDPASVEFVDIKRAVNKIGHRSRSFVAMSKAKRIRVKPPTRDLSCISQRRMRRLSSVETKIQWRRSCIAPTASARIAADNPRCAAALSRIGNVRRSFAAPLAIDRRRRRLRWIDAVRCAVALCVDVDGR